MALKKSTRARKRMPAKKSSGKRSKSMRSIWTTEALRFNGTAGAAAIFLIVVCVVAAAMSVAPSRGRGPQPQIAGELGSDEPLAPQADPKRVPDAKSVADAAAESENASAQPSPIVTITGCLERSDESFRLKDTTGEKAPKSRSWKSGFLKKSPAAIQVVDSANRAKLTDHVGQRVSVTGQLVDREMTVRSLQRLAPSCTKA
jgi:hypothetical protein